MSVPPKVDYYAILEINEKADLGEIRRAFRRLSLLRHPDKNRDDPDAHAAFCTLKDAHDTLSDTSRRMLYDEGYPSIKSKWKSYHDEQERERIKHEEDRARQEQERLQKVASERIKFELSKRRTEREKAAKEEREREGAIKAVKEKEKLAKEREAEARARVATLRAQTNAAKAEEARERWEEKMRREARETWKEKVVAAEEKRNTAWRTSTGQIAASHNSNPSRSTKRTTESTTKSKRTPCSHFGFWPIVEGQHQCSVCLKTFFSFILRCPACSMTACASCKRQLKDRY